MDHLALLQGEVAAMAVALAETDPARTVESCPGWTVADLTKHITAVHRWVLAALEGASPPPYEEVPATATDYAAASTAMVQRLAELTPDAPVWTFNKANQTASFWRRRQLQEVSIHRWDVDQHALDPQVAADGVSEVVDFFLPRMVGQGRTTLPEGTVVLDTAEATWTLGTGEPQAKVSGTAGDLNLLLWGRRALADVEVDGDAAFAASFFDAALTP